MKYFLKNTAGVVICETDSYNLSVIRKEAGREVTKLMRAGTQRSDLVVENETGLTVATITVDVREAL